MICDTRTVHVLFLGAVALCVLAACAAAPDSIASNNTVIISAPMHHNIIKNITKTDLTENEQRAEESTLLETPSSAHPAGPAGDALPDDVSSTSPAEVTERHAMTYDYLYQQGVKHYLDDEWHQCARYMQTAIDDFHWYTKTLTSCRRGCKAEAETAVPLAEGRDTSQIFFETAVRSALCLLKCRKTHFAVRKQHVAPIDVDRDFEMMKPYDYLQLCLFKIGRYQDAASAAVTVLARQPDHAIMSNNLRQYIDDYSADPDVLENLELQGYAKEYVVGDRAHTNEDFEGSVEHMEAALTLYWEALEDCRLMCEEPFDQGWFPDFVSSVANHFTFTFRCKRRCPAKLSNLYGEEIANFLPSIFNYLQFAYQKLGNIPAACGATESFLELQPVDAAMLRNKQFYLSEYQKSQRHFVARKEVVAHAARESYETALLHFIDTEFVFLEEDREERLRQEKEEEKEVLAGVFTNPAAAAGLGTVAETDEYKSPDAASDPSDAVTYPSDAVLHPSDAVSDHSDAVLHPSVAVSDHSDAVLHPSDAVSDHSDAVLHPSDAVSDHSNVVPDLSDGVSTLLGQEQMSGHDTVTQYATNVNEVRKRHRGPVVVMKEGELNGTRRYVADGIISKMKCKILSMLTQVAAQEGDGYRLNMNPHTQYEDFHGLTLSRAGLMVHARLIGPDVVQLVLNVTELARDHIAEYFHLDRPLHFSYTHLVCRTARPEYLDERPLTDMSHTVHVDNCIFQGPDVCLRRPPAYTFRDYSAVLYLNDDFEGGDFVFSDDLTGQRLQSVVAPKCGRMVAFSSGPENPHGVKAVRSGSRCALALWFTFDKRHEEKDRILATALLRKIKDGEIRIN